MQNGNNHAVGDPKAIVIESNMSLNENLSSTIKWVVMLKAKANTIASIIDKATAKWLIELICVVASFKQLSYAVFCFPFLSFI